MSRAAGRNDPCPCGSGKKFKRCCLNAGAGPGHPAVAPAHPPRGELTLLIETPTGLLARRISSALPLTPHLTQGYAAETATHDAAAIWGLPDFVYLPEIADVGSGTRELGDGIVIVGDLGVVLQVKSRATASSDPDRERRWIEKKTREALKQGAGTIRRLKSQPAELTNLRGTTIEIDGNDHRWLIVAVIDHANPPDDVVPALDQVKHPAVVLLRRDWQFLFEQLKSTHAVAEYCERVASEAIDLGNEPMRYYDLARADHETAPQALDPALIGPGRIVSSPVLPLAPAASDDRPAHQMLRTMFEDIALTRLKTATEGDRLRVLAELDRLPVGQRALIGRFMLDAMAAVTEDASGHIVWQLRSVRGPAGQVHLGFGACSHPHSTQIAKGFECWVRLRHHDVLEITNDTERLMSIGVLLTPRPEGQRPWDTTMMAISGAQNLSTTDLKSLREIWPTPAAG
jgi:hypothetical protein